MFDFLKKKKEEEFSFDNVGSSNSISDEVKSSELNMPSSGSAFEPSKPEIFNTSTSFSGVVTERDVQLILAKIELLNKRLDDFDAKISEVLEIARQSK